MGKSKHRKKKSKASVIKPEIQTVETLLNEIDVEINSFNYEKAEELCKKILEIEPDNTKSLEALSGIYIEQSKFTEAENLLVRCIELNPDNGYSKYFSMGQLCDGLRSVTFYNKGIGILEKDLENIENDVAMAKDSSKATMSRILSDAYCSVGEIFMSDCCFEENAEERCVAAINNAINSDTSNPEAHLCLAQLHLVKEEFEEAKTAIEKNLSLWLPRHEAIRDGELAELNNDEGSQFMMPLQESRIKISKMLIELGMFDEATKILDGLIEEDDEIVEVWYLLGWMNYLQGDDYKQNSHYYLSKAVEVSNKVEAFDEDQIVHAKELLEELSEVCTAEEEAVEEDWEPNSSDSESECNKMET